MASVARSKRQRGAATVASSSSSSNSYNKAAKKKKKRQRKEGVKEGEGGEFDLCDAATLSWLAGCDPSVQWMTSQVAPAAVAEALAGSKTGTGGTHEDNVTEVCQERIMDPKSGSWVSKIMAKQDPKTHLWAVDPARVATLKGAPLTPSEMYDLVDTHTQVAPTIPTANKRRCEVGQVYTKVDQHVLHAQAAGAAGCTTRPPCLAASCARCP